MERQEAGWAALNAGLATLNSAAPGQPKPAWQGALREHQARCWRTGQRVLVEDYLAHLPVLAADDQATLGMVLMEATLRQALGEEVSAEEYLRRFPRHEVALRRHFESDVDLLAPTLLPPNERAPAAPPPTVVPGYELIEELGRGGAGVVYKARQVGLNRLVALKMLLAGPHADPAQLERFRTEAEAIGRLQHPNIIQVYEVSQHEGRPFFSMELCSGGSLESKIAGVPYLPVQAAALVEVLARATEAAHETGIVHRDLKPANVLLSADGTPKITDFGLAKKVGPGAGRGPTRTGAVLGTPGYMAPEQAGAHAGEIGPATDVYGLGAILYQLLTGLPPFEGPGLLEVLAKVCCQDPVPPSRHQPSLPRDLETICLTCLQKEPARRYASAVLLAEDLAAFQAGRPIHSRPVGRLVRAGRWIRQRPAEVVLLGVAVTAALGLTAGLLWGNLLAAVALGPLALLATSWLYNARLQAALNDAARLRASAERSAERLHVLLEMTRQLLSAADLDSLLRLVSEATTRLTDADRATIYVLDRDRGELWSRVALGQGVGEIRTPIGVGVAGAVARTGRPVNIADAYADPRFNPEVDRRTGYRTRSLLTLPLFARDRRVLGVFQVLNKRTGAFDGEDVEALTALAASSAVAVEDALRRLPIATSGCPGAEGIEHETVTR